MAHVVRNVNLTTKSFYHTNHPVYSQSRPTYLAEIHAVRLDNTAWVNNPFELFNAWGKAIQNGSMATQTIIAQMSGLNRGGYLPTQEAVGRGAYSEGTEHGWCDHIGGQQLVNNSVDMINGLFASDTAPIARDDSANTDKDVALTIDVLNNDTDPNGDTLYVISVTQPLNGFAVIDGNNTVIYTPSAGFSGNDSFTYVISDGKGTDTATVSVTVNSSTTPPPQNTAPTANAGADKSVQVNQTIYITGRGTDSDGTITAYEWKKGDTVLATTALFDYMPDTVGTDTLTLTVTDDEGATGTDSMNVTVTALPNTQPTEIIDTPSTNDTDAGGDALGMIISMLMMMLLIVMAAKQKVSQQK